MIVIRRVLWLLAVCLVCAPALVVRASPAPAAAGADLALPELLPRDALALVHVPSGQLLWDCAAVHDLRSLADELGALADLEKVRAAVKAATRTDPAETLRFLLGGEVALAVCEGAPARLASEDAPRPRAIVGLARTADADGCRLALDALLGIASGEHSVTRHEYREHGYARIDHKLLAASLDGLLLVATDQDLFDGVVDRWLDGDPTTPAAAPSPPAPAHDAADDTVRDGDAQGGAAHAGDATATLTPPLASFRFDTRLLRDKDLRAVQQPGRRLLGRRLANPLANLLFGGLTLGEGTVEGALRCTEDELTLSARLPPLPQDAPAAWFPEGAESQGVPVSADTLAVLHVRRDLSDWWRQRETLMSEDSQPALAKADENMGLLFGGQSPAEDVFAKVGPDLALVIDRQHFAGEAVTPDVRLPGFCLVARTHGGPDFAASLGVAFQSLMSFINTDRARDRHPPFLLDVVVHEGVSVRTARLVPSAQGEADRKTLDNNFSPSVAVVDDWLLLGTSLEQVQRLVSALHAGGLTARTGNLGLDVDVTTGLAALRENRAPLVANRMLEEGADAETAGRDTDNLLRLVGLLTRVQGTLVRTDGALALDVRFALADHGP